mgnify:FL=1
MLWGSSLSLLAGCTAQLGLTSMPGVSSTLYPPAGAPNKDTAARTPATGSTGHPGPKHTPAPTGPVTSDRTWRISPLQARRWNYLVIHHSSTATGNAKIFHNAHLRRGWRGLGYHFVICNGHGGQDGEIQVGPRWVQQMTGAHTGNTPKNSYNQHGIGICLVGDFMKSKPTAAQLASLERLGRYLATTCNIPAKQILAHRDAPGAKTDCCGDQLHRQLHSTLKYRIARG